MLTLSTLAVHELTDKLQAVLSHLEMRDLSLAMVSTLEAIRVLDRLRISAMAIEEVKKCQII